MAKSRTTSVTIPMSLLEKIICLLEWLTPDLDDYDPLILEDHDNIVVALRKLQESIALRDEYKRYANDCSYEIRWDSRMNRILRKRDEDKLPF